jgi:hypothetical protein
VPITASRAPAVREALENVRQLAGGAYALSIALFNLVFVPIPNRVNPHRLRQDARREPSVNCAGNDTISLAQTAGGH